MSSVQVSGNLARRPPYHQKLQVCLTVLWTACLSSRMPGMCERDDMQSYWTHENKVAAGFAGQDAGQDHKQKQNIQRAYCRAAAKCKLQLTKIS